MRALIGEYGLEMVWAAVLLLLFLSTPARAQGEAFHFEPTIADCPPDGFDCEDFE